MLEKFQKISRSTFWPALIGAVLIWTSLPPLGIWPLAWIGPAFWVYLIRRERLAGQHPYVVLWLVGFIYWTAIFYFLVLPHWATSIGLLALSFYQAFYLPVFIGLARIAVHRLRISAVVAAPIIWVGLELARAHLITGVTLGNLGHSQYRWIELIQISDLAGAYAVSFVVMLAAASLARMLPCDGKRWSYWPLIPAAAVLAATLVYGHLRVYPAGGSDARPIAARVALIQGSIDIELKHDPKKQQDIQQHYIELSEEAVEKYGPGDQRTLDLIVWPETMFRGSIFTYEADAPVPPDWRGLEDRFEKRLAETAENSTKPASDLAKRLGVPLLLGIDTTHYVGVAEDGKDASDGSAAVKYYNSALLISESGEIIGRYDKMHRVIFGEYVPFADRFSWLQKLTPLPTSLAAGDEAKVFRVGDLRFSPNICYENVLPHVIRRQFNSCRGGENDNGGSDDIDVLVNLTNDGWFWGSSELDLHLICGVFRAVECRRPFLIAANTGFSAWIDGDGRILAQGPRRDKKVILAEIRRDGRKSWYLTYGDWPAGICLAFCVILFCYKIGFASKWALSKKTC